MNMRSQRIALYSVLIFASMLLAACGGGMH
jgi:predicted small secreted protein